MEGTLRTMEPALDFTGKTVLLTGAARGIGESCAATFAALGARVAIADLDGEGAARVAASLPGGAIGVRADVADPQSVRAMVAKVRESFGHIDVFVNNAALFDDKTFLESTPADWARVLGANLHGAMLCLHEVLPSMVERRYGRVVCIASDAGRVGQARLSYYGASKGGLIALVKSIAQEVGESGVTLNVVSPGATETPQRALRESAMRAKLGDERFAARTRAILKRYPVGRLGEPRDTAHAVAFLASDLASWITGQVLSVNGGFVMP